MSPSLLDQAFSLIAGFEGCRLDAYLDQGGTPTIGYGATGPSIVLGLTWTQDEADSDLKTRISDLYNSLQPLVSIELSDNQWAAILSFSYNLGLGAFQKSHLRSNINANVTDASVLTGNFTAWDHIGGNVDDGLLRRREAEAALYLSS